MYTPHFLLVRSSIRGHRGCFHILVAIISAAMNMGVPIPTQATIFNSLPKSEISGSYGKSMLNILPAFSVQEYWSR